MGVILIIALNKKAAHYQRKKVVCCFFILLNYIGKGARYVENGGKGRFRKTV